MPLFFLLPFLLPAYVLRFHIGPLPTTVLELGVLAIIITWLITRKADGLKSAWKELAPWRIPLALWLGVGIVSVITAAINGFDTLAALGLFRAYFIEPILIFIVGADVLKKTEHRTRLLQSFAIVAVLLTVYAIIQLFTGWGIPHPWDVSGPGRRATGPFPFPNALALFLVPFGALGIAFLATKQHRTIAIALVASATISSILAQSDGGLVALAAATIIALLFNNRTRRATIGMLVVLCLATLITPPLRHQAEQKLLFKEWSGKVRTIIWQESIELIKDKPLFGAGLGAYPQAILPYHTATWMEVFQYPHTIVLNLWTETGIPGLIAFSVIIIVWVRGGKKEIVIPVVIAILVHGLVDVPYFKNDLAIAFWLLILLTLTHPQKSATIAAPHPTERWQSGRMRHTRNVVSG